MRTSLFAALMMAPVIAATIAAPIAAPIAAQQAPENAAPSTSSAPTPAPTLPSSNQPAQRPPTSPAVAEQPGEPLQLVGVLREFTDGHPDLRPSSAPGRHLGIVADRLDAEGKPVFISRGYRVLRPASDAAGEPIIGPRRYIESRRGDRAPKIEPVEGEAVQSAYSLGSLFRHSASSRARVHRVALAPPASSDDAAAEVDLACPHLPGGDRAATARTLELTGRFTHHAGAGRRLRFASADHLWVFIDGWLVVDLGGSGASVTGSAADEARPPRPPHPSRAPRAQQSIDLDRLTWLRDGEEYQIKVFCASRGEGTSTASMHRWTPATPSHAVATAPEGGATDSVANATR